MYRGPMEPDWTTDELAKNHAYDRTLVGLPNSRSPRWVMEMILLPGRLWVTLLTSYATAGFV